VALTRCRLLQWLPVGVAYPDAAVTRTGTRAERDLDQRNWLDERRTKHDPRCGPLGGRRCDGTIGVGPTFLAQAAAIALSFILVLGIVLPPRAPRTSGNKGVFDGIRLVASRPDLRTLFLLASIPTLFVFPYIGFLNVFARDILRIGAQGLGLLMAVSGCGAVVGSLLVASARRSEGAGRLLLGMTVLYGLPIVGVALSRTLWITLPLLVVSGVLGRRS
jgi:predicted MFS family arabinose efflux permease